MAIGQEAHIGYSSYSAVLNIVSLDRQVLIQVSAANGATTVPNAAQVEAENDASFQTILQALMSLGVVELVSATKHGAYSAEITLDTP